MADIIKKLYRLLNYRERRSFVILFGMMLFEAVLEMVSVALVPLYVSIIAYPEKVREYLPDQGLSLDHTQLLIWASAGIFLFFLAKLLINLGGTYWKSRFSENRTLKLSRRLFRAYMQAPYTYHLQRNSAELLRNINVECTQLSVLVLSPLIEMLSQAIIVAAVLTILLLSVPIETVLFLVVLLAVAAVVVLKQQKTIKAWGQEAQQCRGRLVKQVNEGLGGIKEIMLLGRISYFVNHFSECFSRLMSIQRYIAVVNRLIPDLVELTTIFGLLCIILMLFMSGKSPEAVLQIATIFAVALARIKGSLSAVMRNYTQIQHHQSALNIVFSDLMELEQSMEPQRQPPPALMFQQRLQLEKVWYRYPKAHDDSLKNINLTIQKGEAIGFVGTTGAGKSTLIDVILGILEPTRGSVMIDGTPIRDNPTGWHDTVGYVPQMIHLIDGSIKENIALGLEPEEIDEVALQRAVRGASLNEFIAELPEGLDTIIGERGVRLSGGQRQRVVIARALYRNPQVLILDEGTSALDNTTEQEIIRAVDELKGERTILMIAHRLSTVYNCDRIVLLDNASIEAVGPYRQLLETHEGFSRLAQGQGT
jgi:ATP-binding cassette, subfamily B, bacterial PglK